MNAVRIAAACAPRGDLVSKSMSMTPALASVSTLAPCLSLARVSADSSLSKGGHLERVRFLASASGR
eukprot:4526686-Pleurochrysis_carterae.AAC.1